MTTTTMPYVDVRALQDDLRRQVDGEVRFDPGTRGAYATDSSNYRQVPYGVVIPRTIEAAVEAVAVCRKHHTPITSRGGGTSLAGQACNTAVVIDWSKYCHRLVQVDTERATCVVEPGIVLDELNRQLADAGLMFGPRPATHDHCTIGGMLGNNSCGATAQAYGKTVDNVRRLEILTYDGERMWVGPTREHDYREAVTSGGRRGEIYRGVRELITEYADEVRRRFPDIPRRVSGYNLDSLLPENDFDLARALVGSEGTLVTILRAELALVEVPAVERLVVVGYPDIMTAADDVSQILGLDPAKLEAVDHQLISFEKSKHIEPTALERLPNGDSWLMVSLTGNDRQDVDNRARALIEAVQSSGAATDGLFVDDDELEEHLWRVRESALGATARVPTMPDTWPGWEDSAVPPERLGDYLRDLDSLLDEHGLGGAATYGHFGQGCVHSRIPFDLVTQPGLQTFRGFLHDAADLVARYGGSLSGEHGDGQARGELLSVMFGVEVVEAFGRLKAIFDPAGMMNPGKVVHPAGVDSHLRLGSSWTPQTTPTSFAFPDDEGSFERAMLRCVGVGKCRHHDGGVMCPSYMATREEEHSTRGRARLLFEMLEGHADSPISDGWRSTQVRDALDLCLACKGCKQDCPVGVDMATYKAEFLSHHYEHRLRPRAHYSMGWLPLAARAASVLPSPVNLLTQSTATGAVAKAVGGIDQRREIPQFAEETLQRWFAHRQPGGSGERGPVLLWPDTFTNHFHPAVGRAAVQVLEDAGYRVQIPTQSLCCGLTWISTGQLGVAKRVLARTAAALEPALRAGTPVVGLEPSCTAVFRNDAHDLLPGDRDLERLAAQTVTLAELLDRTPGWQPPTVKAKAMVQTHCHQHAVMGFGADRRVMERLGLDVDVLDSGCCGLAGNFGVETGHFEVSQACAERVLFPALREADPSTLVLADGFSCRTQIEQSDVGHHGQHLAEVIATGITGEPPQPQRPDRSSRTTHPLAAAGALVAVGAGISAVVALRGARRQR
jgi:FAD/FMN-containing dehydrogenase/Fe-S oxidoreductase